MGLFTGFYCLPTPVEHLGLDDVLDARLSDAVGLLPDEVIRLARNNVAACLAATSEAGVDLQTEELLVDVDCTSKFNFRSTCVSALASCIQEVVGFGPLPEVGD